MSDTLVTQYSALMDEIRTKFDTLSKRLKQVAVFVIDNPDSVAFDTMAVIGKRAGVPTSTLIRFANTFGFSGFMEMKQIFKGKILEATPNYNERVKLFRQSGNEAAINPDSPFEVLKVFSMVNSHSLQGLPTGTDPDALARAVDMLSQAKQIYVIGLKRSFCVASYLTYALLHADRKAFLIDGIGGMFSEQLRMISNDDVVVSISYSPYARETQELVEMSANSGAKQIAITDSLVSPIAAFSDVCFVMREAQVDGFRSQIASMCLAQTLAVAMALKLSR